MDPAQGLNFTATEPVQVLQNALMASVFICGLATLVSELLLKDGVAYGRYAHEAGNKSHKLTSMLPVLSNEVGWIIMEAPSSVFFLIFYVIGIYARPLTSRDDVSEVAVSLVLFFIWQAHYFQRSFIYPFLMPSRKAKKQKLAIVLMGVVFNTINSYLNATFISRFANYPIAYFRDARFICGLLIFIFGYALNRQSDSILFDLRRQKSQDQPVVSPVSSSESEDRPAVEMAPIAATASASAATNTTRATSEASNQPIEHQYFIPYGGLFRFVTCPNYLGEIIIWLGWSICSWSLEGGVFCFFTCCNLVPRALAHHRWYLQRFGDAYPRERKAIVPFML